MAQAGGSDYWDGVAGGVDRLPAGWRRRAREEHLDLVRTWTGDPFGLWLKTDLFEERLEQRALLPALAGSTWVGIDVSPEAARQAVGRVSVAGVVADVRRLPFAARAFAGVLSTSTLDHFDDVGDIHRSLQELHRVIRPGGLLILTLDNLQNPLIRLRNALPRQAAGRTGLVPFAVGVTFDEAGGRRALEDAGFTVEASTHLLHAPHVLGTRPARWGWYERNVLPRFSQLADTRIARWSGHYVAFAARA